MKKNSVFCMIIMFFLFLFTSNNTAQCSDAGICQFRYSIDPDDEKKFDVSASYKYGYSGKEDDVNFHSFQLNIRYSFIRKSALELVIPYNIQSGPGGYVNGISDLMLS